jgi:hypothetical protein
MTTTHTTRTEIHTFTASDGETLSYTLETITLPVTIGGETREIEFTRTDDRPIARSKQVFGCRRGQGIKIHRTDATIYFKDGEWTFGWRSGYALNRGDCLIVAFADQVADHRKSQHTGTTI